MKRFFLKCALFLCLSASVHAGYLYDWISPSWDLTFGPGVTGIHFEKTSDWQHQVDQYDPITEECGSFYNFIYTSYSCSVTDTTGDFSLTHYHKWYDPAMADILTEKTEVEGDPKVSCYSGFFMDRDGIVTALDDPSSWAAFKPEKGTTTLTIPAGQGISPYYASYFFSYSAGTTCGLYYMHDNFNPFKLVGIARIWTHEITWNGNWQSMPSHRYGWFSPAAMYYVYSVPNDGPILITIDALDQCNTENIVFKMDLEYGEIYTEWTVPDGWTSFDDILWANGGD